MLSLWHKTLFVHIPKCGGQSVESTFLADLGLNYNRHRRLMLCMKRPEEEGWSGPPRLAHLKAREYFALNYVTREFFDQLYRFAIVRDPFRKIESHWKFRFGKMDFERFVLRKLPELLVQQEWFYCPQRDYLCDEDGQVLVPNLFRLENIASDFPQIQKQAALAHPLVHENKSEVPVAKPVWTEHMADCIRDYYAEDFRLLGYSDKTPGS